MGQHSASSQENEKHRSLRDLLIWLLLIPLIMGTLLCCGQMALMIAPGKSGRDTRSLLSADYRQWAYDKIAPINFQAFLEDIQTEEPTIIVGRYWEPPVPTGVVIAQITATATPQAPSASNTPDRPQGITPTSTRMVTVSTPTSTSTLEPSSTPRPSATSTRVIPAAPLPPPPPPPPEPTATHTPVPPPTLTFTPTSTSTNTPVPPATPTPPPPPPPPPPTWTATFTPQPTPATPVSPTPTYAPIRPIAQNNGDAYQVANGGCRAYFDYHNDNPNDVDIPVGPLNNLNDPAAAINPPQPTHFEVGRVIGAFEFTWYSGADLVWSLDGRTATAYWCY